MTQQTLDWDAPDLSRVKWLVDKHRDIDGEPLLLAVYFSPRASQSDDIYLFEVIENFGSNSVDPDRELFEIFYDSTTTFPLNPGQRLHLVLTNPKELTRAIAENWDKLRTLREAVHANRAKIVWIDPKAQALWDQIRG